MKVKTSITVDKDLLETVDVLSGSHKNRSEFIEVAVSRQVLIDLGVTQLKNSLVENKGLTGFAVARKC